MEETFLKSQVGRMAATGGLASGQKPRKHAKKLLTTNLDFCSLTLVWVQLVVLAESPVPGVSAKVEIKMLPLVAVWWQLSNEGVPKNEEYQ